MSDSSMTSEPAGAAAQSDQALVAAARAGDRDAFGALWERHAAAGRRFAAATTRAFDADDLVAEAYAKIYAAVLQGKGPTGPFRPYLLVTIRNLAAKWAKQRRDGPLEDADEIPDPRATDMAVLAQVDANLTLRAFRTLPSRWQEVLWFTEVDGLSSADVAARMGMTVSGVWMLSLRAREGLRQAWVQAHIDTSVLGSEHRWVLQRVGQDARGKLRARAKTKFDAHLAGCAACTVIAADAVETSNHFTSALVPLAVGVFGAATLGGFLRSGSFASVGTAASSTSRRDGQAATVRSRAVVSERTRVVAVLGAVALFAVTGAAIGNAAIRSPVAAPSAPARASATESPKTNTPAPDGAPRSVPTASQTPSPASAAQSSPEPATDAVSPTAAPSVRAGAPPDAVTPVVPVSTPTITSVDTADGALYPAVVGTARPGALVIVSGDSGHAVTATTAADGRWYVPELTTGRGADLITATGDGRTSAARSVRVDTPQLFVAIAGTTVTVTITGVPDTGYAVQWDGADVAPVHTGPDGRGVRVLQNTDRANPHAISVHATAGTRSGPVTTERVAARS